MNITQTSCHNSVRCSQGHVVGTNVIMHRCDTGGKPCAECTTLSGLWSIVLDAPLLGAGPVPNSRQGDSFLNYPVLKSDKELITWLYVLLIN